ncbi:MAG: DUF3656 domain-containing protein, partial [Verrucomicrobia bacterium]|nr:DUF3656 domain-containing protein [Verrucomicrobiota bacterium]
KSDDRYALEMTFSRGLYSGWMHGVNHQELVGARFGKKRGPFIGEVLRHATDGVELTEMCVPLKPGDGVVFENPSNTDHEQGGFLYAVKGNCIEFQRDKLDFTRIPLGTRLYKTSDPALDKKLRATFQGEIPIRKQQALHLSVSGAAGESLTLALLDDEGRAARSVTSGMPLQVAQKRPLTRESLLEQFGKLGGTPYEIATLELRLEGDLILPISELNRMRRALVEKLSGTGLQPVCDAGILPTQDAWLADRMSTLQTGSKPVPPAEPSLFVLCRNFEQITAALDAKVARIYADFEDIRLSADAVAQVRQHSAGTEIFLATPRIQKPGESGYFKLISNAKPDGVLIRNLGSIEYFASSGLRMTGDFSLNVANPLTGEFLIDSGLERLTISYDLDIGQVLDLLRAAPPSWFELTLHQHMPMFHMEHCVFAAFMSQGKTSLDCGRPCEKHSVKLRDRVGMEHPLKADVGCRNTLFNAVPQTGARFFNDLMQAGLRHYRVELLEESASAAAQVIETYQALLSGTRGGATLWRELRAQSQLGVTSGTLRTDDESRRS